MKLSQRRWGLESHARIANKIQEALDEANDRAERAIKPVEKQLLAQIQGHLNSALHRLIAADKQY